jgi:ribose-phosphate pyrophosphokinase
MKFLNLSDALTLEPAIQFEAFIFNGGEPHIKITEALQTDDRVCITVQARSSNDIIKVLLAHDALQRMGISNVELFIPYFPAARQDRLMVTGEPLSVKVFAGLINGAGFNKVTVFDPHSEVTPALLDRCQTIQNHGFISEVFERLKTAHQLTIIAPDAGSAKKIHHLSAALSCERVVQCDKTRDIKTGLLSAPKVFADDLKGADCLIVDDICDGGGTFIQLAAVLKQKNAGKLYLAVSHGIFSKGLEVFETHFDQIFTTNSFYNGTPNSLLQISKLTY